MPRLRTAVPKYRKHRASGQAVVTLAGRDYYLGPHGTKVSRDEYDRLMAEYLASGRAISFGATEDALTVVEIAADYLKYAKGYYGDGPNSEFHQIFNILRTVRKLYGRTAAVEFGPLQFKAVRQQLIEKGNARTTINMSMRRVTRMFRWAAAEGRIPPTVPQALALVRGLRHGKSAARDTEPVKPVDDAIVEATLRHLPQVVADMVRLQRLTGARPAEVCNLRPCDVDRSEDVWVYRPPSHKTQYAGKERVILIGPRGQEVLLRYLARDGEAYCFRPSDSEEKRRAAVHSQRKTPLSCGNRPGTNRSKQPKKIAGTQYEPHAYRRSISYACDKAFPHPHLGTRRPKDA